ncbi:MAG TPA: hypothetical protein VGI40_03825 [Pirellulaceae bacterium]|jgi:hypothetical protein
MLLRYRLRTLLILLAVAPPLIGFWPAIQRRAVARMAQISALDVAVGVAFTSLIVIRVRLDQSLTRDA